MNRFRNSISFIASHLMVSVGILASWSGQGWAQEQGSRWRSSGAPVVQEISGAESIASFIASHADKFRMEQNEAVARVLAGLPADPIVSITWRDQAYRWVGPTRCSPADPRLTRTVGEFSAARASGRGAFSVTALPERDPCQGD